jgi:hypothetical protein
MHIHQIKDPTLFTIQEQSINTRTTDNYYILTSVHHNLGSLR